MSQTLERRRILTAALGGLLLPSAFAAPASPRAAKGVKPYRI
jgi:hypothetical protein